jgi:hypothetical protein
VSKTLSVVVPLTAPPAPSPTESWVDLRTLAEHIGFGYQATLRMVEAGKIPGKPLRNGKYLPSSIFFPGRKK